jgi:hypothetical protein
MSLISPDYRARRSWAASLGALSLGAFVTATPAEAERRFAFENKVTLVAQQDPIGGIAWSPDGTKIAYVEHAFPTVGNVWVSDLVTGTESLVLPAMSSINPNGGGTMGVTFSPDGQHLLFASGVLSISISRVHLAVVEGVLVADSVEHGVLDATDLGLAADIAVGYPHVSIGTDGTARLTVSAGDLAPVSTYEGAFLLEVEPDGTPILPATRITGPDPGDAQFKGTGTLSPSGDEYAIHLHDPADPCRDGDVYIIDEIQGIVDGDPPVTSRTDPRVFPVRPDTRLQAFPTWSSDGSLLYFSIESNGVFDVCLGGGPGIALSNWDVAVAETADVLAGITGLSVVNSSGVDFGPVASPGGTRFAQADFNNLVVGTWRIADDALVDGMGMTIAPFALGDATGTTLTIASGTEVGGAIRACRPCDVAAELLGACTNSCFTRACDDVGRTLDLGIGGAGCSQHDGDEPSCDLAWHTNDEGVPTSCFYDSGLGECRRCDRDEEDAGNCTNACLVCDDPNNLSNQNYAPGPLGCRAYAGMPASCTNYSYERSDAGVPIACAGSTFCLGCTAETYPCANACMWGGGPLPPFAAGASCEDPSRTYAAESVGRAWACRQFDGDPAGCEQAWYYEESGLPTSCYAEPSASTLPVSVFTPVSPVQEAQLAGTAGSIPAVRDFGPDGATFVPAAVLTIQYTDAELGSIIEAEMGVRRFNEMTSQYDITLPILAHDVSGNVITAGLASFSEYGASGPVQIAQTEAQAKCIAALNKTASKVLAAQGKEARRCLKGAANGLDLAAQACLVADGKGKVAKAGQKTAAALFKCIAKPDFGPRNPAAINAAAVAEDVALTGDVFGPDLGAAAISRASDKAGAGCQYAVLGAYEKIAASKLKAFGACKGEGLEAGSIDSHHGLEACLVVMSADAKVAKRIAQLADTVTKKCTTTDLDTAFPGSCVGAASFATCVDARVECRVCRALAAMDNLEPDCDALDDGLPNGSCP